MLRSSFWRLASGSVGGGPKVPILDLKVTKAAMIKSFRMEEVLSNVSPTDAMFGRRMSGGNMQFFAWPGLDHQTAANAIISMPETIRTCHTVFGRTGVPVDIALDLDGPVPSNKMTSIAEATAYQREVLLTALEALDKSIQKFLPGICVQSRVVLQSPNFKKVSFHVHVKLQNTAFSDFNSLRTFMKSAVKEHPAALEKVVDCQIYRLSGMLRMHRCMKEDRTCALVVYNDPAVNLGFSNNGSEPVPESAAALHSLIIRDVATISGNPIHLVESTAPPGSWAPPAPAGAAKSDSENKKIFGRVPLPVTEEEACTNARDFILNHAAEDAREWRSWINIGLTTFRFAHHFRDSKIKSFGDRPVMDVFLEAWIEFSKKCPEKFELGACEKTWQRLSPKNLSNGLVSGDEGWFQAYRRLAWGAQKAANDKSPKSPK
jgi:hypothetical protein